MAIATPPTALRLTKWSEPPSPLESTPLQNAASAKRNKRFCPRAVCLDIPGRRGLGAQPSRSMRREAYRVDDQAVIVRAPTVDPVPGASDQGQVGEAVGRRLRA